MRHALLLALSVPLLACPTQTSTPCETDAQCPATQRCRVGACGPICLDDTECGSAQVCANGACQPRPECTRAEDCAQGFACRQGRCACTADSACLANQQCQNGQCQTRKRCTADADCVGGGGRCEVTQGLCLPVCVLPPDCAPTLEPALATAIYTCAQGTCTRRCLNDATCGGAGLICKSGICGTADCKTLSECPNGMYCTSATFGRCVTFTTCTSATQCEKDYDCQKFPQGQCPPGFDCSQSICRERPRCLADGDCVSDPPMVAQNGYCAESHCRPAAKCATSATCGQGFECVGALCVPASCRGHSACPSGQQCTDGKCAPLANPTELLILQLSPERAVLEVGDTLALHLAGFALGGASTLVTGASFTVLDAQGQPSGAATVSADGVVTGVAPGVVTVRAAVGASSAEPKSMTLTIYPQLAQGRRVLVLDEATQAPVVGATVRACLVSDCASPVDVVTDGSGVALFPALGAGPLTATVTSATVRAGDGLPAHERATVLGVTAADVVLPLRSNPVHGAAGFNGTINFSEVHTSGQYWVGIAVPAAGDLPGVDLATLLGETFQTELPGLNQKVPVPGSLVLYTSPGFGIPQEVKARSLGLGQPGSRPLTAFAGRANLDQVTQLRSTQLLGYVGAFDYGVASPATMSMRPRVPDTADVDGDGLCTNPMRCPVGSEEVPEYAAFAMVGFQPKREQQRRTEVVVPKVPAVFDQVVVAAVETTREHGSLPLGFSAVTPQAAGGDGTRAVPAVVLRSGAPYGGLEVATPGVWVLAGNAAGTALSSRVAHGPLLPAKVQLAPFLPAPGAGSHAAGTRTFSPSQPEWSNAFSSGGELVRVSLTGSQGRHAVYVEMEAQQTALVVPSSPSGPGVDPAGEANVRVEVVVYDLAQSTSAADAFTLHGVRLDSLPLSLEGYAKSTR